ncbi:MAG: GTP-binding protein HflX, partial [Psychroserpens sp.]
MQLTAKASLNHALLISICTPQFKGDEATESLAELARLVTTLGFKVVGTQSQKLSSTNKVNVLGLGKLAEIAHLTGDKGEVEESEEVDDLFSDLPKEVVDETLLTAMPSDIPSENLPFA